MLNTTAANLAKALPNPNRAAQLPPSVNWHLNLACTMKCRFCFGRFLDVPREQLILKREAAAKLTRVLASEFDKITLTGGEPLLCPLIDDLLTVCKELNRTTMLVSNGSPLIDNPMRIQSFQGNLDWFGISIDSARPEVLEALGRAPRGGAIRPEQYIELARRLRAAGVRLKLNTVVNALNVNEDLRAFVEALAPERWKVFQVMAVEGQNEKTIDGLLIDERKFESFVTRHQDVNVPLVAESNAIMSGSYAMLDPAGRFFDNTTGTHRYSRPVLEVGVTDAFRDVSFDPSKFAARGGTYAW